MEGVCLSGAGPQHQALPLLPTVMLMLVPPSKAWKS